MKKILYLIIHSQDDRMLSPIIGFGNKHIESLNIYNIIRMLPAHVGEINEINPSSRLECNHLIIHINELELEESITELRRTIPTVVFVTRRVSLKSINAIEEFIDFPVFYEVEFEDSDHMDIYNCVMSKIVDFSTDNNEIFHQAVYKPYPMVNKNFIKPLISLANRQKYLYEHCYFDEHLFLTPYTGNNKKEKELEAEELILDFLKMNISISYLSYIVKNKDNLVSENGVLVPKKINEVSDIFNEFYRRCPIDPIVFGINFKEIDLHNYLECVNVIVENFEKLEYYLDFYITFTSVNKDRSKELFNIKKSKIKNIVECKGYYCEPINSDTYEKDELRKYEAIVDLLNLDNNIVDNLDLFYTLGRNIPYIRLGNLPQYKVVELGKHVKKVTKSVMRQPDKFMNNFLRLSNHISSICMNRVTETILKHSNNLKFISDIPVELINNFQEPINLSHRVSRLPLTPGEALIDISVHADKYYEITDEGFSVHVINALDSCDSIYNSANSLNDVLKGFFETTNCNYHYSEVRNSEEFINTLNNFKPTILIYYGHGTYNEDKGLGQLKFAEDKLDSLDLSKIKSMPKVVILGACETNSFVSKNFNIASMFLAFGSPVVIGSHFSVHYRIVIKYITAMVKNMIDAIHGIFFMRMATLSDTLLVSTKKMDFLDCLNKINEIAEKEKINFDNKSFIDEFYKSIGYDLVHNYSKVRNDTIYSILDKKYPEIRSKYENAVKNNRILSTSNFFSVLGFPERIILRPKNIRDNHDIKDKINEIHDLYKKQMFGSSSFKKGR